MLDSSRDLPSEVTIGRAQQITTNDINMRILVTVLCYFLWW